MVILRFSRSGFEAPVEPWTRVVDVCDEHPEAAVPFDCRAANCATCRVRVRAGARNLLPAEPDELGVLDVFGEKPGEVRLACQLVVGEGPDTVIELEVLEP